MLPYYYREFSEQREVIETCWERWLASKTTREAATNLLNRLEQSGLFWLCTITGFKYTEPTSRRRYFIELFLDCVGVITILKGCLVIILPYKSVRLALGDLFIDTEAHQIQNMLLTFIMILTVGLRHLTFAQESRGQLEPFRIYHLLRTTKFDHKQFSLTQRDCSKIRRSFYPLIYFYLIATPLTCLGIAGWLTYAFIINPINYQNLINTTIMVIWTIITLTVFTISAYPSFWEFVINALIMAFTTFSLNSVQFFGQLLVKSGSSASEEDIFHYFVQQNQIYNLIKRTTVDYRQTFFYGIVVVSSYSNFSMFVSTFIGTGNNLFDVIIFTIGISAFNAVIVVNLLGALTVVKVSLCQTVNYQIARRCKLNLSTNLKLLETCERMNINQIGFTLSGLCTMDANALLVHLLENAGLMLMFICNFNKT